MCEPQISATSTPPLLAGRYRIVGMLGAGGHADVFLARDEKLARAVALKRLRVRVGGRPGASRAWAESRVQAQLSHPNIVGLYDVLEVDDDIYLVLELVDGGTLAELRADGPLDVRSALDIVLAVARALDHAHRRGVVHGDVKIENVLVGREGHVKLVDFGVSKVRSEVLAPASAASAGTRRAAAPELLRGDEPSAASDLYALGVLAFETIAGVHPDACIHGDPTGRRRVPQRSLREWAPGLPDALVQLLARLVDPDPTSRPRDAAEVIRTLETIAARWSAEGRGDSRPSDRELERSPVDLSLVCRRATAECLEAT